MLRFLRIAFAPWARRANRAVAPAWSRWCTPLADNPLIGTIADLARSKPQLVVPTSTVRRWREALRIDRPETVLRWHRVVLHLFCQAKAHEPAHPAPTCRPVYAAYARLQLERWYWTP